MKRIWWTLVMLSTHCTLHASGAPRAEWPTPWGPIDGTGGVALPQAAVAAHEGLQAGSVQLEPAADLRWPPVEACLAGDVGGDEQSEVVIRTHGDAPELLVIGGDLSVRRRARSPEKADLCLLHDFDGDGKLDVLLMARSRAAPGTDLHVYSGALRPLAQVHLAPPRGTPHGTPIPRLVGDVDGDGALELVCYTTQYAPHPIAFGLAVYGYPGGELEWSRPTAGLPLSLCLGDLSGDGAPEIVVGMYAVCNGTQADGHVDDASYVAIYEGRGGEPTTTPPVAGSYSEAWTAVANLDGRGRPEIIVWTKTMVWERSDRGVLAVFGPDGKPIAREEFPCSVLSAVAADLMGDGRPEVTVALREGGIGFYDGDLDLLAQYGFAHEAVSVQQAADADADGKSELVVVTTGAREPGLEASGAKVWEERSPALQALSTPRVGWLDLWPRVAWRAQPLPATFSGLEQPTVPTLLLDRPRPLLLAVSPLTTDSGRALAFETMPHRPALRSKVGSLFPGQRVDAIEWDAEGRRAALVAGPDGHLALHDPAGTRPRTLCERGPVGQVRWSPDGRQVAFVLGADPAVADLHVVDVAGGRERAIPGSRGLQGYSWSPDSRRLAFGTTPAEGKGDLCIAPADGGAAALVTGASDRDRLEAFPAWDGGGSRLYFVRSVSVPTRGGRLPGTALACVDLRTGAVRLLTPDATLRAALDRARREMPAVAFSKAVQQDLVPEVAGPLTWDSSRRMLVFALRITRVNRPEYSTDTNRYRGCPDLWTYEVEGDRLSRLTADDECSEADPDWSPQGDWLVYEGQPVQGAGPARVRLTNRLGSFVADLGEGTSPRWEGASSRRVTLIRDGKVQLLTLEADLPEVAGPPSPWGFGVGSLAAGAVLAAVALRTRPWVRLRRSAAFVTSAWRAAQLGFDPDAFRRFVRLLAELDNTLHSLKNAVFVIGAGTGDSVSLDDIAFCLDPENVAAVRTLTQAALEQAGRLARDEALYRHAVSDFSPATRDALVRALDAVLDSQASLARGLQRVNRHAGALDAYGKLSEAARQEAVDRAAADLDAFHALVDGPEGLRRHLLRALDGISLAGPLQQAAQVVSRRATDLGLQVVIPPEAGRIRVCGDPAPLADLFAGCLDNALDSLARRAQEDPNGPPLNVTITVQDGNPVTVAFTDGGMGIAPDLLARLRAGHAVSTKGAGRGSGLTRAREVLARRYPHGALEVSSPGENQGATVRVQVGTA